MGFIDSICNNLPEDGAVEAFHRGPRKSLNLYNASDSVHAVQKAIEELKANYLRSDYARSSKWYLHSCYIFRVSFLRAIGDIMAPRRSCSSYRSSLGWLRKRTFSVSYYVVKFQYEPALGLSVTRCWPSARLKACTKNRRD